MRRVDIIGGWGAAAALLGCGPFAPDAADEPPAAYRFENGRWFTGTDFATATVDVRDGRLDFTPQGAAQRVIDLGGAYVVPPFCEAHNHNLGSDHENAKQIAAYLRDGIFYVKILSNLPYYTGTVLHTYNRPDSVDVAFANGGATGPGGHPIALRERLLGYGVYPDFTAETLADHAYFVIDSVEDLDEKWPLILSFKPDFIKTFLLYSEEYEQRRDDRDYFGRKGLDPAIHRLIVERAHAHDLQVSTHVNTAADFHHAVANGSDEIAHLPGYRDPARIDPADAQAAAGQGTVVVTTTVLSVRYKDDQPALYADVTAAQRENLRLLHGAGVRLAVGSDSFEATSTVEIAHLRELEVFDNATLLRMWTEHCAAAVFPERRIGHLADGYEASFLALAGDPLADFDNTGRITLRVKDGRLLEVPGTAPAAEQDAGR